MSDPHTGRRIERDERIVSAANPTIKLARSLLRRRARQRERVLLVEGIRAISAAIQHGAPIRAVLIDERRRDHITASDITLLRSAVNRLLFVEPSLFESIADTEQPQPVIAICEMPKRPLPSSSDLILAVDGLRDPGNLGTLIRAAAAAGADGVALLPDTVDAFNPKSVRASAGAIFAIPVASFRDIEHVHAMCFDVKPTIVLADGDGATRYDEIDWTGPSMVVIGGEARGASNDSRTYADIVARIPIAAGVDSLNAALAGGIFLFEARRQRGSHGRNTRTDADSLLG